MKNIVLVIVTPTLSIDGMFCEMMRSIKSSIPSSICYKHIVVAPKELKCQLSNFEGVVFLEEMEGTVGVFDAVAQGINWGLREYSPILLSYINSDDLLLPGFGRMLNSLEARSGSAWYGGVNWIDVGGRISGRVSIWRYSLGRKALFEAGISPFTQQGLIFPSELWKVTGGFNLKYKLTADSELWLRMLRIRVSFNYWPEPVACYRIRPGQLSANQDASHAEWRHWGTSLGQLSFWASIQRVFLTICFRLVFIRSYLRRLIEGKRLRVKSAFQRGGF